MTRLPGLSEAGDFLHLPNGVDGRWSFSESGKIDVALCTHGVTMGHSHPNSRKGQASEIMFVFAVHDVTKSSCAEPMLYEVRMSLETRVARTLFDAFPSQVDKAIKHSMDKNYNCKADR